MIWDQLTSPEINNLDRNIPVVFTVSATEQHGLHLPVATDRMIGEHFCNELNKVIPDKVLILPIMSVGISEHHMDFTGTLTIQHQTFLNQAEDILSSVVRHGFRNIILFNSHGGNLAAGQLLLEKFGAMHPEIQMVFATWWKILGDSIFDLNESGPGGVGHAGEFETSLMLYMNPGLVKLDKIEAVKNIKTYDWAEADMIRGSLASIYRSMKGQTSNGVFGNPSVHSVEKGRQITDMVTVAMKKIILDLYSS
ncbi:MAG: creatininase family protein [Bacteroidales bacterium]|nr:creatininase family protein [Bacteroidales bacterium]